MIAMAMLAGRWNQQGQLIQKLKRCEMKHSLPIGSGFRETVNQPLIFVEPLQTLTGENGASAVAKHERGYLPLDKTGADLLFQIISHRDEKGSIVLTTNRAFKHWPEIFNNGQYHYLRRARSFASSCRNRSD